MNDDERQRINEANLELVKQYSPEGVFRFFAELSAIPRKSGDNSRVADYLEQFAGTRGLKCERDATGNVIIRKPGTRKSGETGVILQAHQDMVAVKNSGVDHDFTTDPIEFAIWHDNEGKEWLCANGTTLGADDGIGVALALAVLDSAEIDHPPLEGLFTVDEETDMKGAKAIKAGQLQGNTLINLDAEDLKVAYVSSAAGRSFHMDLPIARRQSPSEQAVWRRVAVTGLKGGHSGIEINKVRANAYVLLARFLKALAPDLEYSLHSFDRGGEGGADNAIPDRAAALISLRSEDEAKLLEKLAADWTEKLGNEYRSSDPAVLVRASAVTSADSFPPPMEQVGRDMLLNLVLLLPLGVFRYIQTAGLVETAYGDLLVETSCNLGIVSMEEGKAVLTLLARGSTASVLEDLMARMGALAGVTGASLTVVNRTDGWEMPEKNSPVQQCFVDQGYTPLGVHAGLECGCLVQAFADEERELDAISVGPDLKDVHSPKERLKIESVRILWDDLLKVLAVV